MHSAVRQSQRETVLSPEPVHRFSEKGWKQTELIESTCPRKVALHFPATVSHSLAVWSIDALTKKSPRSCQATSQTACVWSEKVAEQEAVRKSHSFTVQSPEPVARCEPCGWNSIEESQSVCPSPDITSSPAGTVHIFHEQSSEAVAMICFVGWCVTAATPTACALDVVCSEKASTARGSSLSPMYGFGRGCLGNIAPVCRGRGRVVTSSNSAADPIASSCDTCASSAPTLALSRSRSSFIIIFSFIAASYFLRIAPSVGSYSA
mmetsp:Transcript_43065/g.106275  ORF Transcript_43065/g.106275 Transcript_43065/m.106275 type:complete len:264 (+) Transcript_43065:526-1317(+)